MAAWIVIFLTVYSANAMIFNDNPCELSPVYGGNIPGKDDFTSTVNVASSCVNGTFRWDYPVGHTVLMFNNPRQVPTIICFSDFIMGDIFKIVDQTSATQYSLGEITQTNHVCSHSRTDAQIAIRVDGTETMMYYMAEVAYTVKRSQ